MAKLCLFLAVLGAAVGAGAASPLYRVEPAALHKGGEATLYLPAEHPAQLAVMNPAGDWIYVVDPYYHITYFKDFKSSTVFPFHVNELQGVAFQDGKPVRTLVFVQSGKYLVYVADNLETEPENTFSWSIEVEYKN